MCGGVKAKTRTESDHPDAKFYSTNCWEACCCGLSLKSFIGRSRVASGNFCQTIRRHGKFMLRLPWSGEGAPVADIGFSDDFGWCWGHWSILERLGEVSRRFFPIAGIDRWSEPVSRMNVNMNRPPWMCTIVLQKDCQCLAPNMLQRRLRIGSHESTDSPPA